MFYYFLSPFHPWRIYADKLKEYYELISHEISNGFKFEILLSQEEIYSKPFEV